MASCSNHCDRKKESTSRTSAVASVDMGKGEIPIKTEEPSRDVFNFCEEVQEKILEYAFYNDSNDLSMAVVKSCRAVSKSWLGSTTKILRRNEEPLYHLSLTRDNSVTGTEYVCENGKLLANYLQHGTDHPPIAGEVPFFKLSATVDFFREENGPDFTQCLTRCAPQLVELDLHFPADGGSMTFAFPPLSLPRLYKMTFTLPEKPLTPPVVGGTAGNSVNSIYLLQNIFNGCSVLRELVIIQNDSLKLPLPFGFDRLILPTTLTKLNFDCWMDTHLNLLMTAPLPLLRDLQLYVDDKDNGLTSKILEKFRLTLEHVSIEGGSHDGSRKPPIVLRIPVMEKLTTFQTNHTLLQFEGSSQLAEDLPELENLLLWNVSTPAFHRWLDHSHFPSVTGFYVTLVDDSLSHEHVDFWRDIPLPDITQLRQTFPNLTTLCVTLGGGEDCDTVRYVFKHFSRLEHLGFYVGRTGGIKNADHWDSLLLGIPLKMASTLRKVRNIWQEYLQIELKKVDFPSIVQLAELRSLYLESDPEVPNLVKNRLLISDSVFQFGFLKMPHLKTLTLNNRFGASPEMTEKWVAAGRCLERTSGDDRLPVNIRGWI